MSLALRLGAAALVALAPAAAQEPPVDPPPPPATAPPRALLPEGFDNPVPASETDVPAADERLAAPVPGLAPAAPPPLAGLLPPEPLEDVIDPFDIPEATGRPVDVWGPLGPGTAGYGPALFAGGDARFLSGLMRRLDVPLASRWAHVVLTRALLTQHAAPPGLNPADWIAERAWLLLRLGEIAGAKALVDPVPVDRYTRKLYQVAGQVHLAAADIAGFCPIAATGMAVSKDPLWPLAKAMCDGMEGDDIAAARAFDKLRAAEQVDDFDILLAERVATISGGGGRAANIDWEGIERLTPYRFGVAAAAGVAIPEALLAGMHAGPSAGWVIRAVGVPPEARLPALRPAAAIGMVSAAELVSVLSADGDAGSLRTAYVTAKPADRLAAMRSIWTAATTPAQLHAARLETAGAAARLPVDAAFRGDATALIASLLAAGDEAGARRWATLAGDEAWGLLAPGGAVAVTPAAFRAWAGSGGKHRAALVLAALTGLGRAGGGDWDGLREAHGIVPLANSWTRAIDAAAAAGRGGEVALLAATGLQGDWADIAPAHFARIVSAYARAGRGTEARLLAAEAAMRG